LPPPKLYQKDERALPGNLRNSAHFCVPHNNNNNNNNNKTITEKQNKYQELANEIRDTWKQDAVKAVPIVISATGIIPKSLSQSLNRLNLHPNTYIQMKKVVILGTCSIVRIFLNYTIRPPSLILLMIRPRIGEYFPAKAEK
jgi:hypothetical protein